MDPKELKQLLKEAKEGLKKNDNMGIVKACKTILKKEPENYQANLYLGTACREQMKYQQALEAYKKAVSIDGKQVYAWQGIISVYERQNIKTHNDLLDAYKRVATHFENDDKQKYIENTLKLANILVSQQDNIKALKVIIRLGKSAGLNLEISQLLVQLLNSTTSETRSAEEDHMYTNALEVLVTESPQPAEETYRKFFSQLFRNKHYAKLAQKCKGMQSQWNKYYSPMEWLCRLYLESQIESLELKGSCGGVDKLTDRLFKLHPSSRYGYFARGKYLIEEKFRYVEGFNWINNALESSYNLHAALALVRGKLKFGDYESVLEEALKAVANCTGEKLKLAHLEDFKIQFELLYLEGLIGSNEIEKAEQQCLKLSELLKGFEIADSPNKAAITHKVHFLDLSVQTALKKKDFTHLDNLISSIDAASSLTGFAVWKLTFYSAVREAANSQEKFITHIRSLVSGNTNIPEPELLLMAGVFLYDNEEYEAAAEVLTSLAETAEGRNHPLTWKYLGLLAKLDDDLAKAAKYLRISYDINLDSDVGALLSDIYQDMGEPALKKNLLLDATQKIRKTKSKWVWARLGLMYLDEGNLLEAVESLQCAIRADLEDAFLWECLADAYFYRGSLQAALRCYNQAIERGVGSVYPRMRMSAIHQFLEEEDKAIGGLKELIEENPANSPVHLELTQVCSWVASEKVQENFDIDAILTVENGLVSAVKAILLGSNSDPKILPWLMIGDYSITLGDLSEETQLQVPSYLCIREHKGDNKCLSLEKINIGKFKEIGTTALLHCLQIVMASSSEADVANTNTVQGQELIELLGYLYHHIALSYYKRWSVIGEENQKQFLLTSIQYGKKAIAKCPTKSLYWNTVGLLAFHLSDMSFSQNCFIKALKMDANNVIAWSNLGMIYVHQKEYMLAHKTFAKGQCIAPVYANPWIGQGICAEVLHPVDAPDLFRHACLLNHHPFAIASYGNAICKIILDKETEQGDDSDEYKYWSWHLLVRMEAVTHLCDLISRIERREASPQLYNLKGFVSGLNGFYKTALESFTTAVELSNKLPEGRNTAKLSEEEIFKVHSNKVSSLVSLKMYAKAKEELMTFPELDRMGLTNAALSLYRLNDAQTAIDMYKRILQAPETENKRLDAKIGLALLTNVCAGVEQAKTILFAHDMLRTPRALLTLGAIAVSQGDSQLLKGVVQELRPDQHSSELAPDICFLMTCQELLQGSFQSAVKVILRFIHMHPTSHRLYALACQVLIRYCLGKYHVSIPRHLALCTLKISRIFGSSKKDGKFASKYSGIAPLTHLIECDVKAASTTILKAIRCYPEQRDNWAVLATAYWLQYSKCKNSRLFLNIINILDREIHLDMCSTKIKEWMSVFRVEIAKYGSAST